MPDMLTLDERGFLWFGDFRLPMRYLPEKGMFEFLDRDRRRSEGRGTRLIYVDTSQFIGIMEICEGLNAVLKRDTLTAETGHKSQGT